MTLTQTIIMNDNTEVLQMLRDSLSIYDQCLYFLRQQHFEFLKDGVKQKSLNLKTLYDLVKETPSFKESKMDSVVKSGIIRQVLSVWSCYIKSLVSYKRTPLKFKSKPKLPNYLHKRKTFNKIVIDKTRFRSKGCLENEIKLPNSTFKFKFSEHIDRKSIRYLEITKYYDKIKISIVYDKSIKQIDYQNDRSVGIDIGLNNLLSITTNNLPLSLIVKGGKIKSINQFFNNNLASIQNELKTKNKKYNSKKLNRLYLKRNNKIDTYFHQLSRKVIDWCIENEVSKIIVGHNKGWKQEINLGKKNNQKFVEIPFNKLISYLKYKSEMIGIQFIETEESYTSKTDHLMFEEMKHLDERTGNRKHRGLFVSGYNSKFINADINGSIGILRKRHELTDEQLLSLRDRGDIVSPKVLVV